MATNGLLLARQVQALQGVHAYRARPSGGPEAGPRSAGALTVTLDREPGTPAEEVARAVGLRLGWPVYDRELAEQVARGLGVTVAQVEGIDERGQHWLLECLEGLALGPRLTEAAYVRRLVEAVEGLGRKGNCVLVGHGAATILPPHTTLRVLLVGARRDRVARLMRQFHLGGQEAERRAERIGKERARFLREHFHVEPGAPGNYDLVLNTSRWPAAACADFVAEALGRKAAGEASV